MANVPVPVAPAGGGGGGSTKDPYGFGAWAGKPVNLGPLFPYGVASTGTPSIDVAYQAFLAATPDVQAQIQQELYLAGYYPSTATVSPGALGPDDLSAFKKFLLTVVETQSSAQAQGMPSITAADQLAQRAAYGQTQGALTALSKQTQTIPRPNIITQDDPSAIGLSYEKIAQQELGFVPDQREINAFVAGFQAKERAYQEPKMRQPKQPAGTATLSGYIAPGAGPSAPAYANSQTQGAPNVLKASPLLAAQESQDAHDPNLAPNAPVTLDSVTGRIGVVTPLGDWNTNAENAGLGAGAPQTAANTQYVLRYMLAQAVQKFGNWHDAIVSVTGNSSLADQALSAPQSGQTAVNPPAGQLSLGQAPQAQPATVIDTQPNLNADAEMAARAAHPAAYGANNMAQAFDNFLSVIGVKQ